MRYLWFHVHSYFEDFRLCVQSCHTDLPLSFKTQKKICLKTKEVKESQQQSGVRYIKLLKQLLEKEGWH